MHVKPNCKHCGRPFLGGKDGYCDLCKTDQLPHRKKKHLRCLCGKRAIRVVFGVVTPIGDEPLEVEMPLCRDCLRLELELEAGETCKGTPPIVNPIHIIVVKSLPRAQPRMSGRRL